MNQIAQEKITINIAHRVKTIMGCEKIFVFANGRISEEGEFRELNRFKDMEVDEDEVAEADLMDPKHEKAEE